MMMPRTVIAILPPRFRAKDWPVKSFGQATAVGTREVSVSAGGVGVSSIFPRTHSQAASGKQECLVSVLTEPLRSAELLSGETEDGSSAFERAQPPGDRSWQTGFLVVSGDRPCSAWPRWRPSPSLS